MSILECSEDFDSQPFISPSVFYQKSNIEVKTLIVTFSHKLLESLELFGEVEYWCPYIYCGFECGIYKIKGTDIGLLCSPVGSVTAVSLLEEVTYKYSVQNIVVFGSCGCLTTLKTETIVVPIKAYREEGISYHYTPHNEPFVDIKNNLLVSGYFSKIEKETNRGLVVTTDAIYRETESARTRWMNKGCNFVDMECSAIQAFCSFRGINLYYFFYVTDNLTSKGYNRGILALREEEIRYKSYEYAKEIAKELEGG